MQMNRIEDIRLIDIVKLSAYPCISIYLRCHKRGRQVRQNRIRFKNSLNEASEILGSAGFSEHESNAVLEPALELLQRSYFWRRQSDGLVVLLAPSFFRWFQLPYRFRDLTVVAGHFHIKPLLPPLAENQTFYLLALSRTRATLFRGDRYGMELVEPEGFPQSSAQALRYYDPEKQLQYHTRTSNGKERRAAMFHGHGVGKDDSKQYVEEYFRQIDRVIEVALGSTGVPMVLAGVAYLHQIYREINTYADLLHEGVEGNPHEYSDKELHSKAWKVMETYLLANRKSATQRYETLRTTKRALCGISSVLEASHEGRIETLFVPEDLEIWGRFDEDTSTADIHSERMSGDEDLLNLSVIYTLANGGTAYVLDEKEVPESGASAAILRF
jgi:hypothetical protein